MILRDVIKLITKIQNQKILISPLFSYQNWQRIAQKLNIDVQRVLSVIKLPKKQLIAEWTELLDNGILINYLFQIQSTDLIINKNIIFLLLNHPFFTLMASSIHLSNTWQLFQTLNKITNFPFSQQSKQNWNHQKEINNEFHIARKSFKNKTLFFPTVKKTKKITFFQNLVHSNVSEMIMKEFIVNLYKGAKYATKSLKGPHQDSILKKSVKLNEISGSSKKFLFMDLDQTLIYTNRQKNIRIDSNQSTHFQLYIRPYAMEFLENVSKYYDVYVFTAATREYAEAVITKLNKNSKVIQDYLCRDDCFRTQKGKIIKDLRIVENRQLKDMILVDNKSQSFGLQLDNGIPILDFYGSKNDEELIHLEKTLIRFANVPDVRKAIREQYRLHELAEFSKEDLQEYLMSGVSLQKLEEKIGMKQMN